MNYEGYLGLEVGSESFKVNMYGDLCFRVLTADVQDLTYSLSSEAGSLSLSSAAVSSAAGSSTWSCLASTEGSCTTKSAWD